MNKRKMIGGTTRYLQPGRRGREPPAPARGTPVARAHRPGCRLSRTVFLPLRMRHRAYACIRHLLPAQTRKTPDWPGPLMLGRNVGLLQRVVDRGELGVQVGTEAVDHSD